MWNLSSFLMKAWKKDNFEISAILRKYKLLEYIDVSYEIFNTMGVQGVIEDLEDFIREQGGTI